jgi:hypothetical protein
MIFLMTTTVLTDPHSRDQTDDDAMIAWKYLLLLLLMLRGFFAK